MSVPTGSVHPRTKRSTAPRPPSLPRKIGSSLAANAERFGLVVVWLFVVLLFTAVNGSVFLSTANFLNIFNSQSVLVLLTLALLPTLIIGELDLSFAAVMGASAVGVGYLNVIREWPIEVSILTVLALGVVTGAANSLLIVKGGIDSIVVTLGMSTLLTGISFAMSNLTIAGIDPVMMQIAGSKLLGLQLGFWIAVGACVVAWYVFGYTPLGRYLYFVGAGRDAARLAGIPVDRIRVGTLIASSLIAAMAGVLLTALLGASDPTIGPSYLLPAFSAAFLGTTAIVPGRFNAWGTFVAVYFLVTGITGLQIAGFSGWVEQVFYGSALLLAVVLSRLAGTRGALRD